MKTIGAICVSWLAAVTLAQAQGLDGLAAEALAEERATWQAEVDGDLDAFRSRLDREFAQVTTGADMNPTRIRGREAAAAGIEQALETMAFGDFELLEPSARVLGTTVILSFEFEQEYVPRSGEDVTHVEGVATSVWSKASGEWQNVHFHWYSRTRQND